MTSERRSYLIIGGTTIGAAAATGAAVTHGAWSAVCSVIAVAANTFAAGVAKAPRDGLLSDLASPPVEVTATSDTTTVIHAEAPKE